MSMNCKRSQPAKKHRGKADVIGVAILAGLIAVTVVFFVFVAGKGREVAKSLDASPNLVTTQEWNNLTIEPNVRTNPPYCVPGGVVLAQQGQQGEFYRVTVEGEKLWIHRKYVKTTGRKPTPDVRLVAIKR